MLDQPDVFHAVHALEDIGHPAVVAISRRVCTGALGGTDRVLRKIAGHPAFAQRILEDLERQLADEAWLRGRVEGARRLLQAAHVV